MRAQVPLELLYGFPSISEMMWSDRLGFADAHRMGVCRMFRNVRVANGEVRSQLVNPMHFGQESGCLFGFYPSERGAKADRREASTKPQIQVSRF
jgi:hypothetical protein